MQDAMKGLGSCVMRLEGFERAELDARYIEHHEARDLVSGRPTYWSESSGCFSYWCDSVLHVAASSKFAEVRMMVSQQQCSDTAWSSLASHGHILLVKNPETMRSMSFTWGNGSSAGVSIANAGIVALGWSEVTCHAPVNDA